MSASGPLTPQRRVGLLAVLGLALVVAPLWAPYLHLDDPTYRYERVNVTTGGPHGLQYVSEDVHQVPISREIGCSIPWDARTCAFERYLAAGHTIPTGIYSGNLDRNSTTLGYERYRFVVVNGTAYETTYVPNRSVQSDHGMYRNDLALREVPVEEALDRVSLNLTHHVEPIPPVVRETVKTGSGATYRDVEVPKTTVEFEGEYYRLVQTGLTRPGTIQSTLDPLLTYLGPLLGLVILRGVYGRIEVVDDDT